MYIGSGEGAKSHDDPWATINDKFGPETVAKSHDDPWDAISQNFSHDGVRKSTDTPWNTITDFFGAETFRGYPIRETFFVGRRGEVARGLGTVEEIRGDVALLRYPTGVIQFAFGVPGAWQTGDLVEVEVYEMGGGKETGDLLGAVIWELHKS